MGSSGTPLRAGGSKTRRETAHASREPPRLESFDDWMDHGAIMSFPLIRPHDERSSMLSVRTKFKAAGATTEDQFANRRVLVYSASRRNVVIDFSSSENASVQIDDSV